MHCCGHHWCHRRWCACCGGWHCNCAWSTCWHHPVVVVPAPPVVVPRPRPAVCLPRPQVSVASAAQTAKSFLSA